VQAADVVERALAPADVALVDALIHHLGVAAGCDRTVTFDRRFGRMAGVTLGARLGLWMVPSEG
jgi:predicted nucleic-acid-binding protein